MPPYHQIIIPCMTEGCDARFVSRSASAVFARGDARSAGWLCKKGRHPTKHYHIVLDYCPACRERMEKNGD